MIKLPEDFYLCQMSLEYDKFTKFKAIRRENDREVQLHQPHFIKKSGLKKLKCTK